jgi:hypothetical protein
MVEGRDASALQQLLGQESQQAFFQTKWQLAPWFGRTKSSLRLIDEREVQRFITSGLVEPSDIRIYRHGSAVEPSDYCRRLGSRELIRPARVNALFREGSSVVLNSMHLRFHTLAQFSTDLGCELGQIVGVNGYYSPAGSWAFARHYDTHDVFVLQIAGLKTWSVYNPPIELPIEHPKLDRQNLTCTARPAFERVLRPGDVLYLPRGWPHKAHTTEDVSLHLTIGIQVYTWFDDISNLIDQLASEQVLMRREAGSTSHEAILKLLAAHLSRDQVKGRAQDQLRRASNPQTQWHTIKENDAISCETKICLTPGMVVSVYREKDRAVIRSNEVTVNLPVPFLSTLLWIADLDNFVSIGDMPGPFTGNARLRFARTLVREGICISMTDASQTADGDRWPTRLNTTQEHSPTLSRSQLL